jgi:hypothetical protein
MTMTENFEIKFNGLIAHKATKTLEGWLTKCKRNFKYMDEPTSETAMLAMNVKIAFQQVQSAWLKVSVE